MQPTPENVEPTALRANASQRSSKTPNESRSMMKRALSNMESPSPRVRYGRQTKGMSKERDLFDFHGSSDGEVEMVSKARNLRGRVEWSNDVEGRSICDKRKVPSIFAEFAARNQTSHSEGSLPTPATVSEHGDGHVELSSLEQTSKEDHKRVILAPLTLPASDTQEEPSSSASFISPRKTIVVKFPSPKQEQLQYDAMEDELSVLVNMHPVANTSPIVLLPPALKTAESVLNEREASSDSEDEIQSNRSRKRKVVSESTVDELDSTDILIRLPQEQYLKRSTRSTYGLGDKELVVPTDFSKKPETVAKVAVTRKSKLRRSKTTAFQELRSMSCDEEDEENLPTIENIAPENNTFITRDDPLNQTFNNKPESAKHEKSVGDNSKVPEKSEIPKPGRKRGRPKKGNAVEENKSTAKAAEDNRDRQLTRENPSDEVKSADKQHIQNPSESAMILEDGVDDDDIRKSKNETRPNISAATDDKILAQTMGNSMSAQEMKDLTKPDLNPHETTLAPETPNKSERAPGKKHDQHSPISNGTVAYRVGLSKRARIEPLLRIVRK